MAVSYYAFFDVDGTLLQGTSMLDFLKIFYQEKYENKPFLAKLNYQFYLAKTLILKRCRFSREWLNQHYYQQYKNQSCDWIKRLGKKWYERFVQNNIQACKQEIIAELKLHQKNGAEIVLVSGSFSACLEPLAHELNVKYILSTLLHHADLKYTGKIAYPMIGKMKAQAIQAFIQEKAFYSLDKCYAYGDHSSDLFMLQLVGNPRVVKGDEQLEAWARSKNIPIIS